MIEAITVYIFPFYILFFCVFLIILNIKKLLSPVRQNLLPKTTPEVDYGSIIFIVKLFKDKKKYTLTHIIVKPIHYKLLSEFKRKKKKKSGRKIKSDIWVL